MRLAIGKSRCSLCRSVGRKTARIVGHLDGDKFSATIRGADLAQGSSEYWLGRDSGVMVGYGFGARIVRSAGGRLFWEDIFWEEYFQNR